MKSDNLRHCLKFSLTYIFFSLFQFLSTLLDRENSSIYLHFLKLKNVSLKNSDITFQLVHVHLIGIKTLKKF